ncbi:MAG: HEAT repeat domain-containing protein [Zavarzinella sp.]|nr:HEAT repeat domain-containing protein [Zavarzinella sp.]
MFRSSRSTRAIVGIAAAGAIALLAWPAPATAQVKDKDKDKDRDVSRETQPDAELRRRVEPMIPSVRAALRGDNPDAQRAALAAVAEFPPGLLFQANLSGAIAAFLQKEHRDPDLIAFGIRSYGKSYPESPEAAAAVLRRYQKSEHVEVRRAVADALVSLVLTVVPSSRSVADAKPFIDASAAALPVLADVLEDPDAITQKSALGAVQTIARVVIELYTFDTGPVGEEPKPKEGENRFAPLAPVLKGLAGVVPKLAFPLASADTDARIAAARTIEYLAGVRRVVMAGPAVGGKTPQDPRADGWPTLRASVTARMRDPDPMVRLAITEALDAVGDAQAARPFLRAATADRNVFVRWAAARALGRTAPPKAEAAAVVDDVAALSRLVPDSDIDVRMAGLNALARFGPAARPSTPVVLVAATRGDIEPRVVALRTLAAMESGAAETVPALIDGLQNSDVRLRRAAASGLIRFGADARPAIPELRRALSSTDQDLKLAAAEAILAIERPARLKDL